jgi:hypothetical protein
MWLVICENSRFCPSHPLNTQGLTAIAFAFNADFAHVLDQLMRRFNERAQATQGGDAKSDGSGKKKWNSPVFMYFPLYTLPFF